MPRRTARLMRTAASWIYRLAAKIDPQPPPVIAPKLMDSGETQLEFARRECARFDLNNALRTALRRYSPEEKPWQC